MDYTTYAMAELALADAEEDVVGDFGEDALEEGYSDIVAAIALQCTSDVAAELCQRKLGWISQDVRRHFGPTGVGGRR